MADAHSKTRPERWYEDAFRSDYLRVYPHRDLDSARAEARFLLGTGLRGRVLDLCCGFGRHTLALSEEGLSLVGLDLSLDLLGEARALPGAERLRGRLVRGDAHCLPFVAESFDGVVNLFSSFGYFGELGDQRVLGEVARILRQGGLLVLDLMNPTFVRANLKSESHREGEDYLLRESRALTGGGRSVTKEVELRLEHGEVRRWREEVRLYEEAEIRALLAGRNLEVEGMWGAFDGREVAPEAPRLIVRARRA